jgi:hypothetical protein
MKELIKSNRTAIRLFFFWIGIIATFTYRAIIVLNFYSPYWVKIFWYIGTIGFVLYFGHRYQIEKKRADLVLKYDLIKVVEKNTRVSGVKKDALRYLVETNLTSKSRWNSAFIFWLSILALLIGIIMDLGLFNF